MESRYDESVLVLGNVIGEISIRKGKGSDVCVRVRVNDKERATGIDCYTFAFYLEVEVKVNESIDYPFFSRLTLTSIFPFPSISPSTLISIALCILSCTHL